MSIRCISANSDQENLVCSIISSQIISDPGFVEPIRMLYSQLGSSFEAILAMDGETPCGVITAKKGLAYSNGKSDLLDRIRQDYGSEELWTMLDVAVLPPYQGKGVGSMLIKAMMAALKEKGVSHAMLEIWVRANGYKPAFKLVHLARSYVEYGVLDDFYKDSTIACDFCKSECHCKAQVVVIEF
ncbi:MAG: GNAT family N-acetyltransferase [Sphaerochaetaceae bacterium]|nr:GNAT family N-acetyltransferase [Sphaerochaetaceae bacterium]